MLDCADAGLIGCKGDAKKVAELTTALPPDVGYQGGGYESESKL